MNSQMTLITTSTQIAKGGVKEMVLSRNKEKELESYENIIQNLALLKREAIETNHGEAEAIDGILTNLSALRDSLCDLSYACQ